MDIKCKTCVILIWEKNVYFSTYPPPTLIHLSHRFTGASKPAAQKSSDCCRSHFRASVSTSSSSTGRLPPACEPPYATNTSHRKQETFRYQYPLTRVLFPIKKTQNKTMFFGLTFLKGGSNFDYGNQPLNMCIRGCYLDCHKAGLCCYLVIQIENLLRLLQLFYFHL
jgi:hypothetical protein